MSPSRTGITESTSPRGVSPPLPPFRGGFFFSSCIDANPGCLRPHTLPRLCRLGQPPSVVGTPVLVPASVARPGGHPQLCECSAPSPSSRPATVSCANPRFPSSPTATVSCANPQPWSRLPRPAQPPSVVRLLGHGFGQAQIAAPFQYTGMGRQAQTAEISCRLEVEGLESDRPGTYNPPGSVSAKTIYEWAGKHKGQHGFR